MKMSVVILLVMLLLCCIFGAITLYSLGLWSFPLPERDFVARDLLLGTDELGERWVLLEESGSTGDPKRNIIIESWGREFVYRTDSENLENLQVGQFVYRCDNKVHARSYLREDRLYFSNNPPPDDIVALFQPRYADKWSLYELGGFVRYSAVYDEYFISFGVGPVSAIKSIGESTISYEQIAEWLRVLDERAGQLLGKASDG